MSQNINPHATPSDDAGRNSSPTEPSTWRRNFGSLGAIVLTYFAIAATLAFFGHSLPSPIVYPLLVAAFCCSTWANFQLGPRIGWGQGGLPVVFILIVGWAVVYVIASLTGAGIVYWVLDPGRSLH